MNEKEIRKAKVGGVESIRRRHIFGCFIIYFSHYGAGFLSGVATVFQMMPNSKGKPEAYLIHSS